MDRPSKKLRILKYKAKQQGWLSDEDFAAAIRELFITYPIIDTGTNENVNSELLLELIDNCKMHPISFKKIRH